MSADFLSRDYLLNGEPVRVSWDRPLPEDSGHRCRFRIAFPSRTVEGSADGVDAVQALLMAMEGACRTLTDSPEWAGGGLTWSGIRHPGLPEPDSHGAALRRDLGLA